MYPHHPILYKDAGILSPERTKLHLLEEKKKKTYIRISDVRSEIYENWMITSMSLDFYFFSIILSSVCFARDLFIMSLTINVDPTFFYEMDIILLTNKTRMFFLFPKCDRHLPYDARW